jgi:hypothetical protein
MNYVVIVSIISCICVDKYIIACIDCLFFIVLMHFDDKTRRGAHIAGRKESDRRIDKYYRERREEGVVRKRKQCWHRKPHPASTLTIPREWESAHARQDSTPYTEGNSRLAAYASNNPLTPRMVHDALRVYRHTIKESLPH